MWCLAFSFFFLGFFSGSSKSCAVIPPKTLSSWDCSSAFTASTSPHFTLERTLPSNTPLDRYLQKHIHSGTEFALLCRPGQYHIFLPVLDDRCCSEHNTELTILGTCLLALALAQLKGPLSPLPECPLRKPTTLQPRATPQTVLH